MTLWIVVGLAALLALLLGATYNALVAKRNQVRNAWAQIDVQLKRRYDLIPNLVNAVKGYMAHERGVLERVTDARAAAIAAGSDVTARAEAEGGLTRALRSVFAVAEGYPELRASRNVLALQEELSSTENRVAFARQFYNDAVMTYNTRVETFPTNLLAGIVGFAPLPLFIVEDPGERAVPEVRLG